MLSEYYIYTLHLPTFINVEIHVEGIDHRYMYHHSNTFMYSDNSTINVLHTTNLVNILIVYSRRCKFIGEIRSSLYPEKILTHKWALVSLAVYLRRATPRSRVALFIRISAILSSLFIRSYDNFC